MWTGNASLCRAQRCWQCIMCRSRKKGSLPLGTRLHQSRAQWSMACCLQGPPYKPSLKVLAERFLKRPIQQGSHDSIDDAKAAMDLALLKISHGPSYGTSEPTCCSSHTSVAGEESTRGQ